jgi:hypothetical protein
MSTRERGENLPYNSKLEGFMPSTSTLGAPL